MEINPSGSGRLARGCVYSLAYTLVLDNGFVFFFHFFLCCFNFGIYYF
jgi:hypothetical protein